MKIALVHDYIKEYGGAERVLEALHEIWPRAPVFTTVYLPKFLGPHRKRFEKWDIRTSWLQNIPFAAKLISPFRLITPFIFKSWDFSDYDVVIVSATGAYNPNLIKTKKRHSGLVSGSIENVRDSSTSLRMTKSQIPKRVRNDLRQKGAIHICYCHTPPRYLYGYPTARDWKKNLFTRFFGSIANHVLRMVDFKSAQNVDFFIANSQEVKARIKKFYRKDAIVINPPVDFTGVPRGFHTGCGIGSHTGSKDYYLAGGRLARAKRVDLAVKACTKLKLPLKIFGKEFAGYGEELREMAGSNVEFLGEVTEEEKWKLMAEAKAFIFPSESEDFGITPVEAMAVGTPVIAYRSGGVQETVIEGKTGIFFNQPTVGDLVKAIQQFNNLTTKPLNCIKQAKKFSKEVFVRKMKSFVNKAVA